MDIVAAQAPLKPGLFRLDELVSLALGLGFQLLQRQQLVRLGEGGRLVGAWVISRLTAIFQRLPYRLYV